MAGRFELVEGELDHMTQTGGTQDALTIRILRPFEEYLVEGLASGEEAAFPRTAWGTLRQDRRVFPGGKPLVRLFGPETPNGPRIPLPPACRGGGNGGDLDGFDVLPGFSLSGTATLFLDRS